ncbi:MAG: hypothetical protein J1F42_00200 [Lachnospiraceae bacterium]|nr:hypothetical protein [Lachnospiraceae bacterium]
MRKFQQQQILDVIQSLHILHGQIKDRLNGKDYDTVQTALADCQEAAIQVGEAIEQMEGTGTQAVAYLEQYCENVYQISVQIQEISAQKVYKSLESNLIKAENDIKHMPVKLEAVFLPYKVSMWDSLESVWMAADQDPNCDAYVIPIPYYDKNRDGNFSAEHYEGDRYPDYVPVTHYNEYDFESRRPDMIFIHNPYDEFNHVTSVHPFFYSKNLKQYTDCLVYIPYYCTSGGMNEAQGYALSYYFADCIVIQAEKYRKFFDPSLPHGKLLPLGSPKFDKVVRLCNNPPEPPEEWKEKMAGKKVCFYNTSISGMLANTEAFLKKMEYVFKCFAGCENACLLWRPHPLLESTFDSMRASYKPVYEKLKQYFFENGIGIYDDTPEIETTIALCDAYVGDSGTSVTSLFGVAGKPLFILNNRINSAPAKDDWKGEIITGLSAGGNRQFMITHGNKLFYSPDNDYQYQYCCDLSDYAYGSYYSRVITVRGKDYICPANAQDILVIKDGGIEKKIELEHYLEKAGAFYSAIGCAGYLFLIPNNYPAIVRYNTQSGEVRYFTEHLNIFVDSVQGEKRFGGFCAWNGYLFLASPVDNHVLAIHAETGKTQVLTTNAANSCGCAVLASDGTDLWFLPYEGYTVTRWNPDSGEVREYVINIDGLQCYNPTHGYECESIPFSRPAFYGNHVYLPPRWGNKYVCLDKNSGEVREWIPPFEQSNQIKPGYYRLGTKAKFIDPTENAESREHCLFSFYDKKLYNVNFETGSYSEIELGFKEQELRNLASGFGEISEWMQYGCMEDSFNSLSDFLENRITGNPFDRDRAIQAFGEIAANVDGTSGNKIYEFVCGKLSAR